MKVPYSTPTVKTVSGCEVVASLGHAAANVYGALGGPAGD